MLEEERKIRQVCGDLRLRISTMSATVIMASHRMLFQRAERELQRTLRQLSHTQEELQHYLSNLQPLQVAALLQPVPAPLTEAPAPPPAPSQPVPVVVADLQQISGGARPVTRRGSENRPVNALEPPWEMLPTAKPRRRKSSLSTSHGSSVGHAGASLGDSTSSLSESRRDSLGASSVPSRRSSLVEEEPPCEEEGTGDPAVEVPPQTFLPARAESSEPATSSRRGSRRGSADGGRGLFEVGYDVGITSTPAQRDEGTVDAPATEAPSVSTVEAARPPMRRLLATVQLELSEGLQRSIYVYSDSSLQVSRPWGGSSMMSRTFC
jgi:hypothetical protein